MLHVRFALYKDHNIAQCTNETVNSYNIFVWGASIDIYVYILYLFIHFHIPSSENLKNEESIPKIPFEKWKKCPDGCEIFFAKLHCVSYYRGIDNVRTHISGE